MILIEWPRAAIGKGRPRMTRQGRAYTPAATRDAENDLAAFALRAMHGRAPITGPVHLAVCATYRPPASWSQRKKDAAMGRPKTTKPDLDNVVKLSDALIGICFADDAQIASIEARKIYGDQDMTRIVVSEAKL